MARRRPGERGIALLLVLWIFMVLGVLALDFAQYMRDDAMAAINFAEETRGYYVALAGMNRAIFDAERRRENPAPPPTPAGARPGLPGSDDDEDAPLVPPDAHWHEGDFGGFRWAARMTDEEGRLSLNRPTPALLTRVVTNLMQGGDPTAGLDRRAAEAVATVVDSILDWRDTDDLKRLHGAESDYYLGLKVPYTAKNGFFDSPEELLLVQGVTPELFYGSAGVPGLRDIFSVHNKTAKLNVHTAPPAVLQVLLGTDPATTEDLVAQRDEGIPILAEVQARLLGVDPALAALLVDNPAPRTVTIEARADISTERNRSHVAAVVDLASEAGQGAKILRWLDRAPWDDTLPGGASPPEPGEDGHA